MNNIFSLARLRTVVAFLGFIFLAPLNLHASSSQIDILVFHRPAETNISVVANNWAATLNGIFQNSQISMTANIVGVVPYNIQHGANASETLTNFSQDTWVKHQRNSIGADFVVYVGNDVTGVCGIAYSVLNPEWAFSLVRTSCGALTFAHELGHNMGLRHSYAQGTAGVKYRYGRGHGVNGSFVTIMAYPSAYNVTASRRMAMFSNPNTICRDGHPCGVVEGQIDDADAAKALNKERHVFSQYRHRGAIHVSGSSNYIHNVGAGAPVLFTYNLPYWDSAARIDIYRNNSFVSSSYAYHDGYSYTFSPGEGYGVFVYECDDDQYHGYLCHGLIGTASVNAY
jgi:hypothetical protein